MVVAAPDDWLPKPRRQEAPAREKMGVPARNTLMAPQPVKRVSSAL